MPERRRCLFQCYTQLVMNQSFGIFDGFMAEGVAEIERPVKNVSEKR